MPEARSRRLVIDACVARSAGGPDTLSQEGAACRDALEAIYAVCHRVVMTKSMLDEWRRHGSSFARLWVKRMFGARKVERIQTAPDPGLLAAMTRFADQIAEPVQRQAVGEGLEKDRHVLEAALQTEQRVVSHDRRLRDRACRLAEAVPPLQWLVWVDPVTQPDCVAWLEEGAPADRERTLAKAEQASD